MKKLFNNLFNKKAQLQSNRKQVFQDFHDTSNEFQSIISDIQEDVDILIQLNREMQELNDRNIEIYDEILAHLDKSIAKQEGVLA